MIYGPDLDYSTLCSTDPSVATEPGHQTWREALVTTASDGAVAQAVLAALESFLRNDAALLVRDVNERTICGSLAEHLRPHFQTWDVDCEYNRDGHEVKRANGRIVVPDIIVHRRGTPENLLVTEVKKSNTTEPDAEDLAKLQDFKTSHLAYRNALFLRLNVRPQAPDVQSVQWV